MKQIRCFWLLLVALQLLFIPALTAADGYPFALHTDDGSINIDPSAIDEVMIQEKNQLRIKLKKRDGVWLIANHHGYPVAPAKVSALFNKLAKIKKIKLSADSPGAQKRQQMTVESYARQFLFIAGGRLVAKLSLDSLPKVHEVHLQQRGVADIEVSGFDLFNLPLLPNGWINKDLLKIPEDQLVAIVQNDNTIVHSGGGYKVEGVRSKEEQVPEVVENVVKKIIDLEVISVIGARSLSHYIYGPPFFHFSVILKDGKQIFYSFAELVGKYDGYLLKLNSLPYVFQVCKPVIDYIQKYKRNDLVRLKIE